MFDWLFYFCHVILLRRAAVVFAVPEWHVNLFYHCIYFSLQTSEIMSNNLGKQN